MSIQVPMELNENISSVMKYIEENKGEANIDINSNSLEDVYINIEK